MFHMKHPLTLCLYENRILSGAAYFILPHDFMGAVQGEAAAAFFID